MQRTMTPEFSGGFVRRFQNFKLFNMGIIAVLSMIWLTSGLYAATIEIHQSDSFEAAVENLNPGDTLIVHEGTYADSGRISIKVKGTVSAPVVIKGADGESRHQGG